MLRIIFLVSSLCLYALCVAQSSKTPASANTKQLQFDPSSFKGSDSLLSIPPKEKPVAKKESIYITNEKYFEMFSPPEIMPEFDGDIDEFIQAHIIYPPQALLDSIQGNVIVQYLVDKKGNTLNHKVVRGLRRDVDEEAFRVVQLIKYAKPAFIRKIPVHQIVTVAVKFRLPHQLKFDPSSFKGSDSLLNIPPQEKSKEKEKEKSIFVDSASIELITFLDCAPIFGKEPMENWIERTMVYPEKALHEGIEGRVIAQCWVEKDGSVSHTQIVRGVEASLDSEAWRVVSLMKFAHPAMQRKQPVRVSYTIPVNFKLPVSFYDTLPKRDNRMFACPEPMPDGFDTIDIILAKNIHYPPNAIKDSVEGRVIISCWINKKGGTFGHKILKSIHYDLDQEALRVCRLIKFKEPAYNSKGKAVYSYITLPINFKLDREKVKKKASKIKKIGKDTNE
jgi:TonB family protein